ncbi:MAG: hypothetical protein Q8L14_29630 [Myxococcales bacterium]|nr:hypothetical protein [Myxococcales bacterium]
MMKRTLLLLLVVGCTPGPAPTKPPRPHPFFPIAEGTHALHCTACHALTNTNYSQFSCLNCHEHAKEKVDPRHTAVGGYSYETGACYACHRDGSAANAPNVSGLTSDPGQNVSVTALVPTFSATTIVSVTAEEQSLPMPMNHAVVTGACSSCHANVELSNFYPGQLHASLLTLDREQPTTCAECHASSAPVGFVGPIAASRSPPSGEMKHDAVAWVAGAPSTMALVTADCSTCHVAPSKSSAANWATRASFHAALQGAQPGSCLDCHANTRPGGLNASNAALPRGLVIDHRAPIWLGDCVSCHAAGFTSWAGGTFHRGAAPPSACLPCHAGERPTELDGGFKGPPFDFGTNAQGITHGAGQDCAVCHVRTQDWTGGNFTHGPTTIATRTCVACHTTQRPTSIVSGFDHAQAGNGDCFGCHQATTAFTQLSDWAGGQSYPGSRLISSSDRFVRVTQLSLRRSGALVTGSVSAEATLYNTMLHTSAALPSDAGLAAGPSPGDTTTCWHCHTSAPGTTTVTSFPGGQFHAALTTYRSAPDAGVTPLSQPSTRCADCHSTMRPTGIVQKTDLQPMDHDARFTSPVDVGGQLVSRASELDCSVCHQSPGGAWSDGAFHSKLPATAQLDDCTVCHYPLMASAAAADGAMKHRSTQVTFQTCDRCHAQALANTSGTPTAAKWAPGVFHANAGTQPATCIDCHAAPAGPRQSTEAYEGDRQWMSHALSVVTAKDCAFCHAADVGTAWSPSTRFHRTGITATSCRGCHGPANGGTAHNMPTGLIDTATITSASATTGRAGVAVQIAHTDVNVSTRDCNVCHTQIGIAPAGSAIAGREWAQASFHRHFTGGVALVGRCSTCHLNLKPTSGFAVDHSGFTATSATDCSACHSSGPSWRLSGGSTTPASLSLGGFTIAQPPAENATTTQAGLNGVPHPAVGSGLTCTSCHAQATGGRRAFGYDHALAPVNGCSSCHEAGSDLVGTSWSLNAPGATQVAAQCARGSGTVFDRGGDTRPVGIATLACSSNAESQQCGTQNCALNHFYPADCGECHAKPSAVPATVQTGASYVANWRFQHFFGAPAQSSTCCKCHGGSCR